MFLTLLLFFNSNIILSLVWFYFGVQKLIYSRFQLVSEEHMYNSELTLLMTQSLSGMLLLIVLIQSIILMNKDIEKYTINIKTYIMILFIKAKKRLLIVMIALSAIITILTISVVIDHFSREKIGISGYDFKSLTNILIPYTIILLTNIINYKIIPDFKESLLRESKLIK